MNEFSKTSSEFEEAMEAFYNLMKLADEDRAISLQAATELRNAVDRFVVTTETSLATTALQKAMGPIARNIGETVKSDISTMYEEAEKAQECAEAVTASMTQKARKILWPILGFQALFIFMILGLITGGVFYFEPVIAMDSKREEYAQLTRQVEDLELLARSEIFRCAGAEGEPYLCAKLVGDPKNDQYHIQQR